MIELDLLQGSDEWLADRLKKQTASEASMMMGQSRYFSRTQLLDHKKGWITEISAFTQRLFDDGHKAEEMARPLAEKIIGCELYPVVGQLEDSILLGSYDGLTMMEDIVFEHKIYNKVLAENVLNSALGPEHYWQLEQLLLVSGSEKVLFVCSDGTEEKFYSMWYVSIPERREQLIAGWAQFAIDLETHQPQFKTEKVIANKIYDLPLIAYKMDGMTLTSNMEAFKCAASELVADSKVKIETDQDFADADAMVKVFKTTETKIKSLIEQVVGEVKDIDTFTKDLKFIGEEIRQARIATDKQVKARKEELRFEIVVLAETDVRGHTEIFRKLGVTAPISLMSISKSISDAMKGKKTVASLQDAADTAVSKIKIELDGWFHIVNENASFMQDFKEFKFLFSDWKDIAFKANDDFQAMVKIRVAEHKEAEQKKADDLREQIRIEEEAKATAKAAADQAKVNAENAAKEAAKQAESDKAARLKRQEEQAKIDEDKRIALEEADKIALQAHEEQQQKEAKGNPGDKMQSHLEKEAELLEARRKSEGEYERKISDEGLSHRTGNTYTTAETVTNEEVKAITSEFKEPTLMSMPSKTGETKTTASVFGRLPTLIEAAYIAGFMAGYNQESVLTHPKKEAGALARQHANSEAA